MVSLSVYLERENSDDAKSAGIAISEHYCPCPCPLTSKPPGEQRDFGGKRMGEADKAEEEKTRILEGGVE